MLRRPTSRGLIASVELCSRFWFFHADSNPCRSQWTVTTKDGKNSAQFEETLLITETGVEVLTAGKDWVA